MTILEQLRTKKPHSKIFHYTSQSGLIGIVATKSLWATSIHHLNDATEFGYARTLMKAAVAKKQRDAQPRLIHALNEELDNSARINLFIACFSEERDLLSQWRAYCPGGNGYSIGFTYAQLAVQMERQDFFLAPCVYDVPQQEKIIAELLDDALSEAAMPDSDVHQIASDCLRKFFVAGPLLKHPSFAEEVEWRLVSKYPKFITDDQIAVREGKSMPLPYFRFRLAEENEPFPKPSIVVGPNPHMDLAVLSVQFLLGSFGTDIKPTQIPYRAW